MIYTINLDWLQVYAHGKLLTTDLKSPGVNNIRAKDSGKETIQFKRLWYIYFGSVKVAECQQEPRTSCIHKDSTIIKIDNRVLYSTLYFHVLSSILQAYNLRYKGITRIDICYDTQELAQGRDIQTFLKKTIQPNESDFGFVYNNQFSHATYHTCRTNKGLTRINSVKWGSTQSRITAKIYDKTLELIEVKDKPWIREVWERNGIDYQYNDSELYEMSEEKKRRMVRHIGLSQFVKKPVYRFEISIKAEGKDVISLETGEIFTLSLDHVQNSILIHNLFFSYAAKYFDFRENTGQKNRRFFKKVKLWQPDDKITFLPMRINEMQETGRSEKVCFNKLAKTQDLIEEDDNEMKWHFRKCMEFLAGMASVKKSLYMVKRELKERERVVSWKETSKEYWVQYWNIMQELRGQTYRLPTQADIDFFMSAAIEEIPDLPDDSGTFYQSLWNEVQLMQPSETVIPERAERVSNETIAGIY